MSAALDAIAEREETVRRLRHVAADAAADPAAPETEAELAAARTRWPGDPRLALVEADLLLRRGRRAEAEAHLRAVLAAHPGNPWPALRLARLLLARGADGEAGAVFARHVWRGATDDAGRRRLLASLDLAARGADGAEAFLRALLDGSPGDRAVLVRLAALRMRERRPGEALHLLDEAARHGPLPDDALPFALDLQLLDARFAEALDTARVLLRARQDRPDLYRKAAMAAAFAGRAEEAAEAVEARLRRWPGDWLMLQRYNRSVLPARVDRALFALLSEQAEAHAADDRWRFQFALACLRHGETARALALLRALAGEASVAPMAAPLRRALETREPAAWRSHRGVSDEPGRDVQVVRTPGAAATLVVLAGLQGGLGYLPPSHADALLAALPANVVYLADLHRAGFTGGVRGLGADEPATLAALRELLAGLGTPAVVTLGASLGGYGALRYGALLGARAAVSLAGPTRLAAPPGEAEGGGRRALSGHLMRAILGGDGDLLPVLERAPGTRLLHVFDAGDALDAAHAARLRPLPNAELRPIAAGSGGHFAALDAIADGSLLPLLADALRSPPSAERAARRPRRAAHEHVAPAPAGLDPLSRLALEHGTDKFGPHAYTPHYHALFGHLRGARVTVLEAGVGGYDDPEAGGASLRMWRDYFPAGRVVGIDVFPKRLDLGERVQVHQGSQSDPAFVAHLGAAHGPFHVVVDDGSHVPRDTLAFLDLVFPHIAEGGFLAIEDTQTSYWPRFGGGLSPAARTATNLARRLVDEVDHAERRLEEPGLAAHPLAASVRAVHRFHNLLVLEKGDNDEPSNLAPHGAAGATVELALQGYAALLDGGGGSEDACMACAELLLAAGRAEAALARAEAGLERWPDARRVPLLAGTIALRLGRLDAAEAHFRRAMRRASRGPAALDAHVAVARSRAMLRRVPDLGDRAAAALAGAEAPGASLCLKAARVFEAVGDADRAIAWLGRAVRRCDGEHDAHFAERAAAMLDRLGRPEAALAAAARAAELAPHLPAYPARHGALLARAGRHAEAEAQLAASLALDWWQPRAHLERSRALAALGRFEEAFEAGRAFRACAARSGTAAARSDDA